MVGVCDTPTRPCHSPEKAPIGLGGEGGYAQGCKGSGKCLHTPWEGIVTVVTVGVPHTSPP